MNSPSYGMLRTNAPLIVVNLWASGSGRHIESKTAAILGDRAGHHIEGMS
jgi:hypothetical protein